MADQHNPWQTESSTGNPWSHDSNSNSNSNESRSQTGHQSQSYNQGPQQPYAGWSHSNTNTNTNDRTGTPADSNPWSNQASTTTPYQPPPHPPPGHQSNPQYSQQPSLLDADIPPESRPVLPPRRADTDTARLLAAQPDSGEQLEHMQQYESSKVQTDDERNQAELQRQFPGIDGSLIAAIYNDYKEGQGPGGRVDLGSVRELLQELQS